MGLRRIGKLRKVALVKPSEHEINELFVSHPTFFLLRYQAQVDVEAMIASHEAYAELLTENGVEIEWMEFKNVWGAHGPMRKLFVCEEVRIVRGGAIIPRFGHASYKRGLEREFQRFLAELGCPILMSVSGSGICEVAPMFVAMAEDAWIGGRSCAANQDGLDQVLPVMYRSGAKDIRIMNLNTIMETFDSGGEFHVDMVVAPVDHKVAVVYPAGLDWDTYVWLRDRGFKLIEIPREEQRLPGEPHPARAREGDHDEPCAAHDQGRRGRRGGGDSLRLAWDHAGRNKRDQVHHDGAPARSRPRSGRLEASCRQP